MGAAATQCHGAHPSTRHIMGSFMIDNVMLTETCRERALGLSGVTGRHTTLAAIH